MDYMEKLFSNNRINWITPITAAAPDISSEQLAAKNVSSITLSGKLFICDCKFKLMKL
jgi:hypothetical protein